MTLKELVETKLFATDDKIYVHKQEGCMAYILDFGNKVTFGNCLTALKEEILNKEISLLEPQRCSVIVYFK